LNITLLKVLSMVDQIFSGLRVFADIIEVYKNKVALRYQKIWFIWSFNCHRNMALDRNSVERQPN
jgi:hypothetical protein